MYSGHMTGTLGAQNTTDTPLKIKNNKKNGGNMKKQTSLLRTLSPKCLFYLIILNLAD